MKNKSAFAFGVLSAAGTVALLLLALITYLHSNLEEIVDASFSPPEDIEMEMTINASQELNLNPLLGKSAAELATYLAQGDTEKETAYQSAFMSGLDIAIHIESQDRNRDTTQTIYIVDKKVANQALSISGSHEVISGGTVVYESEGAKAFLGLKENEQTSTENAASPRKDLQPTD